MKRLLLLAALSCAAPAHAIDPGTVQGSLRVNEKEIPLRHAYAHLHDNAEGLLDRPKELRVLVTDREVPQESLIGIAFLPVEDLAREGRVEGLILKLHPDKPDSLTATLLRAPAEPGMSLLTQTKSATGGKLFSDWKFAPTRVLGAIEHRDERKQGSADFPALAYSIRFSAPVFNEPAVTADLKGKQARESPQVRALLERARALGMEKRLRRVARVVVRGERAVAIYAKNEGWSTLARKDGEWKPDDQESAATSRRPRARTPRPAASR